MPVARGCLHEAQYPTAILRETGLNGHTELARHGGNLGCERVQITFVAFDQKVVEKLAVTGFVIRHLAQDDLEKRLIDRSRERTIIDLGGLFLKGEIDKAFDKLLIGKMVGGLAFAKEGGVELGPRHQPRADQIHFEHVGMPVFLTRPPENVVKRLAVDDMLRIGQFRVGHVSQVFGNVAWEMIFHVEHREHGVTLVRAEPFGTSDMIDVLMSDKVIGRPPHPVGAAGDKRTIPCRERQGLETMAAQSVCRQV